MWQNNVKIFWNGGYLQKSQLIIMKLFFSKILEKKSDPKLVAQSIPLLSDLNYQKKLHLPAEALSSFPNEIAIKLSRSWADLSSYIPSKTPFPSIKSHSLRLTNRYLHTFSPKGLKLFSLSKRIVEIDRKS